MNRGLVSIATCAVLAACSTVEVPDEHYYRIDPPRPRVADAAPLPGLRVERIAVAPHLRGDRLMVSEGAVLVRPYRFHRWAGPLDKLVEDALVTGFSRSGRFERVAGPADAPLGAAGLLLRGRVLEMQQHVTGSSNVARVTLDVELVDRSRGAVVMRREVSRDVEVQEPAPEVVVAALSRALGSVVEEVLGAAGEYASAAQAVPMK